MVTKRKEWATTIRDMEIFTEAKGQATFKVRKQLVIDEKASLEKLGVVEYSDLVKRLEENSLPLEIRGEYIHIQLPQYSVPGHISQIFYEVQLRGYIPIIVNAEQNSEFKRNPDKLYDLVTKGALVQIEEESLIGGNGKGTRKLAVKLCRHRLVHVISPEAGVLKGKPYLSKSVHAYLQKKVASKFPDYLKTNANHILESTPFHPETPIRIC
ncbi:hypothetical protein DVB69_06240 [Sporosarcina sp. BI001-red]|uniref:CpsB/CapC family capsule biosynthesis tyrosine phosphatase n=1 Tax=Sporosarcina sp. BI001-red TaxID=2282866 RepID=UPI000E26B33F|nr:CpsB/CapC family capsule biosynthesis tyrosine phosphatase [Sporosarcina sp. BI001-red]REB08724.1 hypothetical protein DVB69_06240 [Sporosarcina sp. BI001-red]